jgi:hypothetical protein
MTCGLYGGIDIHFLNSNLIINPNEVTTRSGKKEFSHTKCKIRREDGEKITEQAVSWEPVLLKFDGTIQDRYMFHPEAVSLHNEDATLTLWDGEKILEKGTINKHFQNSSLGDVIEYIVDRRQDPEGVIQDQVIHPGDGSSGFAVKEEGQFGLNTDDGDRDFDGIGDAIGEAVGVLSNFGQMTGWLPQANTALKFKKMTPFGAIQKTATSFALDTWVDPAGYFHYGLQGSDQKSYEFGVMDERAKLKEYNVTIGSGQVSEIILSGTYEHTQLTASRFLRDFTGSNSFPYGRAWLVDENGEKVPGKSIQPEEPFAVTNPQEAEDAARQYIINHFMGRKNGNIVINAGASKNKPALTSIDIGDLISSSAEIEEHCQRSIDTGIFLVTSVQHKLDKRRGWLIDIGVGGLPAANIASESWWEEPADDEHWEIID